LLVATVAAIVVASAGAAVIRGTPRADTLRGTAAADRLYGSGGNDHLFGLAGNDYLNSGPGNDVVTGGPGADTLVCGPGRDTAVADGSDKIAADCETVQGMPKPPLSVAGASLAEGNAGTQSMSFTVTLGKATPLRVSVAYATADGTATAGSDYTATSGTLVFAPGQTSKTVAVPILGDTAYEPDETFMLTLSNPVNATLGTATATGRITSDDKPPHAGHYSGTTAQGEPFAFDVASDGMSLSNLSTVVNFSDCDGTLHSFRGLPFDVAGPIPIGPDRTISGPVSGGPPALTASGSIQGSFDAADKASGTLTITLNANIAGIPVNCRSGNLAWSAA
jgi:hypothetical protein